MGTITIRPVRKHQGPQRCAAVARGTAARSVRRLGRDLEAKSPYRPHACREVVRDDDEETHRDVPLSLGCVLSSSPGIAARVGS